MIKVIAVFDIGKTNKKIFLFDKNFDIVYTKSTQFQEVLDDDNYPCDDIESIEKWIKYEIQAVQDQNEFRINAINFSTHGATLAYLDKKGKRITPLYNYLKPLDIDFSEFYKTYGGIEEFSRKTASPAYGMLNAGLQLYWLKKKKPHFWKKVNSVMHYPQYLSYLFTNKITVDYTSVGAHTATWDYDTMQYHNWLEVEKISLPDPKSGSQNFLSLINGQEIIIGNGVHDSSSSIVPLLENNKNSTREFVLLSTGTWIICMNPFSKQSLSTYQLDNDCLCFMTPKKQQIKSSMKFLGHVHEIISIELGFHFGVEKNHYLGFVLNKQLCKDIFNKSTLILFPNGIASDFNGNLIELNNFDDYEKAYYQFIFEITELVYKGIIIILDKNNDLKDIYITGGFKKNKIFVEYLRLMMPDKNIKFPKGKNASALGAALLMKEFIN